MQVVATTAAHSLPDGSVTLLGAVRSVTGAMTRVDTRGASLLVDCGVAQGDEARDFRFPDAARGVDAVVLTHAHNDHVGTLPILLDRGFDGPIVGTAATLEIAEIVLLDGLALQGAAERERDAFRRRFRALARTAAYDRGMDVAGFQLSFREAGHILGSASVEIESKASRVVISGDLGRPDSPILRDFYESWSPHKPVDLVVMESTYGDGEHRHSHDDIELEMERILNEAHARGGHILVPAFAIGRTQTLLYHLNTLVEAGRVRDLPVALDTPMGLRVTESYQRFRKLYDRESLDKIARGDDPLDFDGLYAVSRGRESARLREVREPMLIIAGSGMCTGGRIIGHLQELLPRPETTMLFVGFQAPGTLGAKIQRAARATNERERRVDVFGEETAVRASVETLSGLSAHADRRELMRWLKAIPGVRRVALHHGEVEAQRAFVEFSRGFSPSRTEPV